MTNQPNDSPTDGRTDDGLIGKFHLFQCMKNKVDKKIASYFIEILVDGRIYGCEMNIFVDSILGQHLSLRRKFSAFYVQTIRQTAI